MTEKDLIRQLKAMREIKPRKDWVVLTKSRILEEEATSQRQMLVFDFWGIFTRPRMALAVLTTIALVTGTIMLVNYSLEPKIAQQDVEEAKDELTQLQEQVLVLQKTIDETIKTTAKKIAKVDLETTNPEDFREIVLQTRQVIREVEKIEDSFAVLGVKIDVNIEELETATDELTDKSLAKINVEEIIEDWENRAAFDVLSQKEKEILAEMKELYGEKKYIEAWELFLINQ